MLYQESALFPLAGIRRQVCTAEHLLKTIFANKQEGLLVIDSNGLVTQITMSLAEVLHQVPSEIVGHPLVEVSRHGSFKKLVRVLQSGQPEPGCLETLDGRCALVHYLPVTEEQRVLGAAAHVTFLNCFSSECATLAGQYQSRKRPARSIGAVQYTVENIVGTSPQLIDLKETILKVAPRNSTILITGESGTGKELFAQSIHAASLRRSGPFIKINCAAIPDTLLESEFFGYEEGAFTGGRKGGQVGKLELAHGGTVFLDEIGELSFNLQAKLLRFIQDREIQKLGSGRTLVSDVRIVAATNVNLDQLVKYKKFREDLYYRLNVVNIHIPPLRERREDIPALVDCFIQKFNRLFRMQVGGVAPEVQAVFQRYSWPGNVRELENVIERAFNVLEGDRITLAHLPAHLTALSAEFGPDEEQVGEEKNNGIASALLSGQGLDQILEQSEKMIIMQALMLCKGNKARAASMLNISRPGLYKKLLKYGLT
ncbi:MAG: sigma-54 interaction domain-containing protein [Desulfurispora sp.]|uniref:sigma-54 interaction domain-containing protein n=1 Tax=Desulfurispora sp. TaxID=3014275 RepID=UPI004049B5EB